MILINTKKLTMLYMWKTFSSNMIVELDTFLDLVLLVSRSAFVANVSIWKLVILPQYQTYNSLRNFIVFLPKSWNERQAGKLKFSLHYWKLRYFGYSIKFQRTFFPSLYNLNEWILAKFKIQRSSTFKTAEFFGDWNKKVSNKDKGLIYLLELKSIFEFFLSQYFVCKKAIWKNQSTFSAKLILNIHQFIASFFIFLWEKKNKNKLLTVHAKAFTNQYWLFQLHCLCIASNLPFK